MKVTVILNHSYGHPDNRPTKEAILKVFAEQLPKAIHAAKGPAAEDPIWFRHWNVSSISVEV